MSSPLIDGFCKGIQEVFLGTVTDWVCDFVNIPFSSKSPKFDRTITPQWEEILNTIDDDRFRVIIILAPPGGGKTTFLECLLSYIIARRPGPTGVGSQTNDTTNEWIKTRLLKVFEATEPVKALMPLDKNKITNDYILFPHMPLIFGGANMTNFQEKSLQYALGDEVWQWAHGLVKELEARLHDRWNGKMVLMSQGGYTESELEKRFEDGDKRFFGFTCPHCKTWHRFTNNLIKYEKKYKANGQINWPETDKTVHMMCTCGAKWEDTTKNRRYISNLGSYKVHNPDHVTDHASFQFSAFSVWQIPWKTLMREWIAANEKKEEHDNELLRTYVMKRMVEFADAEVIEEIDSEPLFKRRENYVTDTDPVTVLPPEDVLIITAGVDVQGDRLEVSVDGWGVGQESWGLDYAVLMGSPQTPDVWKDLDDVLARTYTRSDGVVLDITGACVDTGYWPDDVYKFVKPRQSRKIYATKGSSMANMPIVSRPKKSGVEKAKLFMIGTDTAKAKIYARLNLKKNPEGRTPGFIHFPDLPIFDEVYFRQLTSEKIAEKNKDGEKVRYFQKNGRNEALDTKVYSMAAFYIINPNFDRLAKRLEAAKSEMKARGEAKQDVENNQDSGKEQVHHIGSRRVRRVRRPGSFVMKGLKW